jgi:hypothetical protein
MDGESPAGTSYRTSAAVAGTAASSVRTIHAASRRELTFMVPPKIRCSLTAMRRFYYIPSGRKFYGNVRRIGARTRLPKWYK